MHDETPAPEPRRGQVWAGPDGQLFLLRCPKCDTENWAPAVASGQCYACQYQAQESDITP